MGRRTIGGILLVLGAVLIAAGLVVMFVIVPGMKQFPDDVDTVRNYEGTVPILLDAQNLGFLRDLNVNLERHVKTEEVDGDLALVSEQQTLSTEEGQPLLQSNYRYSIDRKTMEFDTNYPESWKGNEGLWDREGLVMGWPIDTEKKDYMLWSDNYREPIQAKFDGEVEHDRSGMDTYLFTSSGDARPIPTEVIQAAGFPAELTQEQLATLIQGLEIDTPNGPLVKQALPLLIQQADWPDPVPLTYYYAYDAKYWIEPQTGAIIDTYKKEIRSVGFSEELITALKEQMESMPIKVDTALVDQLVPVEVFTLEYQATDQSVQDAKGDAQDVIDQLNLYGQTLPIAGIVAGAVLVLIGLILIVRRA
jgi:hypothetical protein